MQRWLELVVRRRRTVLAATLLATLALAPGLLRIRNDNSPRVFFLDDAASLTTYAHFQRDFGSDHVVRVIARGPGIFSPEGIAWLGELETRLRAIFSLGPTAGLATLHRWHWPEWPPTDARAFRDFVLADPLHRDASLVNQPGDAVSILVGLFELPPAGTHEQLRLVEAELAGAPPGIALDLVGVPVVERALDQGLVELLAVLFPLVTVGMSALLWLALRDWADVLRALAFVGICELVVHGALGWLGVPMTVLLSVIAPLLAVVGLATALHVLLRARAFAARGLDAGPAVVAAFVEKGWPVFWTAASTLVAFGSFVVSPLPSVRTLGVWCGVGLFVILVAAFTFYPALLAGRKPGPTRLEPYERELAEFGRRLAGFSIRRRGWVLGASVAIGLAAAVALPRLPVETNALHFLRSSHPVRERTEAIERSGLAVTGAELVLRVPPGGTTDFRSGEGLDRLAQLAQELRSDPALLGTISAGDLLHALERWQGLTHAELPPDRVVAGASSDVQLAFAALVTPRGDAARITLLPRMRGFHELGPVFVSAVAAARRAFPGVDAEVTGAYPLVLAAQREMLHTMALGLALSFVCIAGMFLVVTRSLWLTGLALIPNVWPMLVVLGAMGWLGVALDSATVTIAAVSLGLAVDNTFHTLGDLRPLARDRSWDAALETALERNAGGHVLTAAVLVAGFGVIAFSRVVPISNFAAFLALSVVAALYGDLAMIPALLGGRRAPQSFAHAPLVTREQAE